MTVNLGDRRPLAIDSPVQPNVQPNVQPPQQGVPAGNPPVMNVPAPGVSPLPLPSSSNENILSSEPALSLSDDDGHRYKKYIDDWMLVASAIRNGDKAGVHRLLDQGLIPGLIKKYENGCERTLSFVSTDIFQTLRDVDLIDRFINLYVKHGMQYKLFDLSYLTNHDLLLHRLFQSVIERRKDVRESLEYLMIKAIRQGDSEKLKHLFRTWKESCPECKPDWDQVYRESCDSKIPDLEIMKILASELKPDIFFEDTWVKIFHQAARSRQVELVARLCEWLDGLLDEFAECDEWRRVQHGLALEELEPLIMGGFPITAEILPQPDHEKARDYQLTLYGPALSKSAFANLLRAEPYSPAKIMNFLCRSAYVDGKIPATSGALTVLNPKLPLQGNEIAYVLFQTGVSPSLAIKLAHPMADYLRTTCHIIGTNQQRIGFYACLNECIGPDAVEPLQDPLAIEQSQAIHTAMVEHVREIFGEPVDFFAGSLACIRSDGTIDSGKLALIYGNGRGLPTVLVAQIDTTLKTVCSEVMARPVPVTVFKAGMTGFDILRVFHDWIRKEVARMIILRLPQELGRAVSRTATGSAEGSNGNLTESTAFYFSASVNYLAASVISQYAKILQADFAGSVTAMFEACRGLPDDESVRNNQSHT
jgi:hypothetical protein